MKRDAIHSQQLVEGVLAIRPRLPKDELAGTVRQRLPFERHAFAVRFHVQLLDMRREPRQRLRQPSVCTGVTQSREHDSYFKKLSPATREPRVQVIVLF